MDRQPHSARILGLDIFRAVAILFVVLAHGRIILDDTGWKGFPFFRLVDGVELFFVLSGFLIGGILLRRINKDNTFSGADLLGFWRRRWYRTLPAYFLILAVNIIIVRYNVIHEGIHNFNWKYFFFLQNFAWPCIGFFRESWSLSIEEWFYLTTPVLLLLVLRFTRPRMAYILVAMAMILFSPLWRLGVMDASLSRFWVDLCIRKEVLTRLDSIGYGLLAAWLFYYYRGAWDRYRAVAFATGIAMLVCLIWYRPANAVLYHQVLYFSLYPLAVMLLLPAAASIHSARGIAARAVTHISRISYSMYLIHFSLVAEVIRDQWPPHSDTGAAMRYAAYWVIVIVASTLLYYGFEKPMMDLRDKV